MTPLYKLTILKSTVAVICVLHQGLLLSQVPLLDLGFMDDVISEPSGLAMHYNTTTYKYEIWVNNDYQYPDSIYSMTLDGLDTFARFIDLDITYKDWEDMTKDDQGNLYVADFGNWTLPSEDQIIKIPDPNTYATDTATKEIIKFSIPTTANLESEAMFHYQDSLYIVIKNIYGESTLTEGVTYIYRIPDHPAPNSGTHIAILHDSVQTLLPGDIDPSKFRITGADISPDRKVVTLLSYQRIWVLSCFTGTDFFSGSTQYFEILNDRQYEGITFKNNIEVYISKEGSDTDPNYNPKIYALDLSPFIDRGCLDCEKTDNPKFVESNLGWYLFNYTANGASFTTNINKQAVIDVVTPGTNRWHVNLRQQGIKLEMGHTYQVSFAAWTESNDQSISVILNNVPGSTGYAYHLQAITTTPSTYTFEFTMMEPTDINALLSFNVGKEFAQKFFLDNLSLQDKACTCPVEVNVVTPIVDIDRRIDAQEKITLSNTVSNSLLELGASIYTLLNPGLQVDLGSELAIYNEGCQ